MENRKILLITIMAIALSIMIAESEAGCWNYITGSRCDNEAFWSTVGYKTCNRNCKGRGFKRGKCGKNTERCFGFSRRSNVCKCYK